MFNWARLICATILKNVDVPVGRRVFVVQAEDDFLRVHKCKINNVMHKTKSSWRVLAFSLSTAMEWSPLM